MTAHVLRGDARHLPLPDGCVDLIVTSPPYFGLRSYTDGGAHYAGQIGSEPTPAAWLDALLECTREWVRVLKPDGNLFVNLGDKYDAGTDSPRRVPGDLNWIRKASSPRGTTGCPKSLLGLPWRYAHGCTDQLGLILRAEIIWAKPNGLPESVTDRVRRAHEQVFHLVKQPRYYAAVDEIREPHQFPNQSRTKGHSMNGGKASGGPHIDPPLNPLGKLPGSVWEIPSSPLQVPERVGVDHFAAFPPALVRPIVLGWSPPGVCTACGHSRRPVVEGGHNGDGAKAHKAAMRVASFNWAAWKASEPHRIIGYACACPRPDAPTRPAVVLDPFGGTGTTALVASCYGRTGITVDLSADYCRLAHWRVNDPGERARARAMPKPPPIPDGMEPLFTM